MNAQSLNNKIPELEAYFADINTHCDVVMFSETWYNEDSEVFKLPNKNTFYLNRTSRRGGGVSLLIDDSMKTDLLTDFCCITNDYEMLCVESKCLLLATCSRPPDGDYCTFFTFLEKFFIFASENRQSYYGQ